jgi:hypothetical protein
MIDEVVSQELTKLSDYWVKRNRVHDEAMRIFVYQRIHRELLAFFVCLTERFARHHVREAGRFIDALSDGVREEALIRSGYAPAATAGSTLHRARGKTRSPTIERAKTFQPKKKPQLLGRFPPYCVFG